MLGEYQADAARRAAAGNDEPVFTPRCSRRAVVCRTHGTRRRALDGARPRRLGECHAHVRQSGRASLGDGGARELRVGIRNLVGFPVVDDVHDLERGIAVARAQVHAVADRGHVDAAAGLDSSKESSHSSAILGRPI
jgi:hypothetical protein